MILNRILTTLLGLSCIELIIEVFMNNTLSSFEELTFIGKISLVVFVLVLSLVFLMLIVDFILWLAQHFR